MKSMFRNAALVSAIAGLVKAGAAEAAWLLEMTSPGNLTRNGWTKTALKPGDKVVLDINPLKDDSANGGRLVKATLVDSGKVYDTNYKQLEAEGRY